MRYTSSFISAFLTTTAALVGALPPSGLESRADDLDPNLFTVPEDDLITTTNLNGGLAGPDFSSSLIPLDPNDANQPLFDDLDSSLPLPADNVIISDSLASSCSGPARKKRQLFDEDSLLLCKTPHRSQ